MRSPCDLGRHFEVNEMSFQRIFHSTMSALKGKKSLKETEAWQKLHLYFEENKNSINILEMFNKDPERFSKFSIKVDTPLDGPYLVDFSKNRIDSEVLDLLVELARERGLEEAREAMFSGEKINFTEDRAVLHVALRNRSNVPMMVIILNFAVLCEISP